MSARSDVAKSFGKGSNAPVIKSVSRPKRRATSESSTQLCGDDALSTSSQAATNKKKARIQTEFQAKDVQMLESAQDVQSVLESAQKLVSERPDKRQGRFRSQDDG